MTDFDYEILSVIAQYGEAGISRPELEKNHFKGYDLLYTLNELTRVEVKEIKISNGQSIAISNVDSACLKKSDFICENIMLGMSCVYSYYSITNKGRSLLQNWQHRQKEKADAEKARRKEEIIASLIIGVGTGIVATIICSNFLGL